MRSGGLIPWSWRTTEVFGAMSESTEVAVFFAIFSMTGLGLATAEIPLVSYTILILLRNIVVGLDGVPADVLDAARGMGYRPLAMLLRIELPLATPAILAGLRIATVTTIGLVTVTALIGQGGLGSLGAVVPEDDVAGHQSVTGTTPGVRGGADAWRDSAASRLRRKKSACPSLHNSISGIPRSSNPTPMTRMGVTPLWT